MSISFAGIPFLPYVGTVFSFPVKLPQGVKAPPGTLPPMICPVMLDWNVYWQAAGNVSVVGVDLNLQAQSTRGQILDRIASVKIDNTGSVSPVYVIFPDTGDVIACAANTTVTFPCLTNLLSCQIVAAQLTKGFLPTTKIFFYNSLLPPAVDTEVNQAVALWKASPSIQRGSTILNSNYGVPALADQATSSIINVQTGPLIVRLWNTPTAFDFLYVGGIHIGCFSLLNVGFQAAKVFIESTGVAGVLYEFDFQVATTFQTIPLLDSNGCNLKLDGKQTWQMRYTQPGPASSGFVNFASEYTTSNL